MKCTNNKLYRKRKRKKQRRRVLLLFVFLIICCGIAGYFYWLKNQPNILEYESKKYGTAIFQTNLAVDSLCVTNENVTSEYFQTEDDFHAIALFRPDKAEVLHANKIHEKLYPASTTKILTLYIALQRGTLTDIVTISENAVNVPSDSSKAGFKLGDQVSFEALLYSLMLPSGNDSAVAIAEYISGSEEEFMNLMNSEAKRLGATNSNFVTAHGYPDENHYTTAYDMYLIFNQCIKDERFLEIVSKAEYKTTVTQQNGKQREMIWKQSNQFVNGARQVPDGVQVIGGKTGTTNEAGACLILYSTSASKEPYISIIMGADSKPILYNNMTKLISTIPVYETERGLSN